MKKYAIAGAGSRSISMFAVPLAEKFAEAASIVGVYDANRKRAELLNRKCGGHIPVFESFGDLLAETKPDIVIVATVDRTHHDFIIQALEAGCDVISEKPLTVDEEKSLAILEAEKRTNKKVTVTFNLRFMPFITRLKEIVKDGAVGNVLHVHFEWFLDTSHGADYFRRWHRRKENSGGLLVHKSTHHFDAVNWILEDEPEEVNAFGALCYYGPTRDERSGRCLTCSYQKSCEFYLDITKGPLKELYLDCEDVDGYFRDGCVFSEEINIEDTMSVNVKYAKGALMSYSLTAHSPYEGFKMVLNGTDGRLEAGYFHGSVGPYAGEQIVNVRLFNRKQEEMKIKIPVVNGVHGGGDERLLEMIIRGGQEDPLKHQASSWDGVMSNIIGIAANHSMKENKRIRVADLLKKERGN